MSTDTITHADEATEICSLDIGGMTCASCVGRIEKALLAVSKVLLGWPLTITVVALTLGAVRSVRR